MHYAEWQPVGLGELERLYDMVAARWRLNRVRAIEAATLDAELFTQRACFEGRFTPADAGMRQSDAVMAIHLSNPPTLDYLSRAEARCERAYNRARKELWKEQTARLGHAPVLQPVIPPPADEKESTEPGQEPEIPMPISVNFADPEDFAWTSRVDYTKSPFVPIPRRPIPFPYGYPTPKAA